MWPNFCKALDAGYLFDRPEYADDKARMAHRHQLRMDVGELTRRYSSAELVERLNAVGVPCGPINNIGEAFEDDQVKELRMTRPAPHQKRGPINLLRSPLNFSRFSHPSAFHRAAPQPGQHTTEILLELGYDAVKIQRLREQGVIAEPSAAAKRTQSS
jgi:crotonobetainyl-CoA:carnitine CoA-transferase CaiB-like acyl-CoA transferase